MRVWQQVRYSSAVTLCDLARMISYLFSLPSICNPFSPLFFFHPPFRLAYITCCYDLVNSPGQLFDEDCGAC